VLVAEYDMEGGGCQDGFAGWPAPLDRSARPRYKRRPPGPAGTDPPVGEGADHA